MSNLSIALLSLAAFSIFVFWQWIRYCEHHDEPYSEDPTEAGRKFMDDPNENGVTGL